MVGYQLLSQLTLNQKVTVNWLCVFWTDICSGSEAGSYLRLIDSCITQLKAPAPSRTCHESKEEEQETKVHVETKVVVDTKVVG